MLASNGAASRVIAFLGSDRRSGPDRRDGCDRRAPQPALVRLRRR
jgi:hypothetical protein